MAPFFFTVASGKPLVRLVTQSHFFPMHDQGARSHVAFHLLLAKSFFGASWGDPPASRRPGRLRSARWPMLEHSPPFLYRASHTTFYGSVTVFGRVQQHPTGTPPIITILAFVFSAVFPRIVIPVRTQILRHGHFVLLLKYEP